MVDPEFERKHPRDPADGRFTDNPGSAWAQRISDSIGHAISPGLPPHYDQTVDIFDREYGGMGFVSPGGPHGYRIRPDGPGGYNYEVTGPDPAPPGYLRTSGVLKQDPTQPNLHINIGDAQNDARRRNILHRGGVDPGDNSWPFYSPERQAEEHKQRLGDLPDFPIDGGVVSVEEFGLNQGLTDDGYFAGFEFWDAYNEEWRDGGNVTYNPDTKQLEFANDFEELSWHGAVIVRRDQPTTVDTLTSEEPNPEFEYYDENADNWLPGGSLTREKSQYHDGWDWIDDDGHEISGEIPGRLIVVPTNFDTRPLDPDHADARQVRALDLIEQKSYSYGGYQILGPDGQWHTIEEAYQDDPDQEVMELIADGLHLPELDTSEELTIRRTPLGGQ